MRVCVLLLGVATVALMLVLLMGAVSPTQALYMLMAEGERKCFYEELPAKMLAMAKFDSPDMEDLGPIRSFFKKYPNLKKSVGIHVVVRDPLKNVFLDQVTDRDAQVSFKAEVPGTYELCFTTNTSSWWPASNKLFRFNLAITRGEMAEDYEQVARKEHLDAVGLALRRLHDRLRDVSQEQGHFRFSEERNRDLSELINTRITLMALLQTLIVVGAAVFQLVYLGRMLKKKGA